MSEHHENKPKKRKETIENYRITTQVTPEVENSLKKLWLQKSFMISPHT